MSVALRQIALRTTTVLALSASVAFAAGCGSSNDSSNGGSSNGQTEAQPKIQASTGKEIFTKAGCISCHTLADANASGQIGPNLDKEKPGKDEVVEKVTNGDGRMPSFSDKLTTEQIDTVAQYVSTVAGR